MLETCMLLAGVRVNKFGEPGKSHKGESEG